MDREIWRGKDVGYIVKKKMNRSCRKNGMVSVNRWGFGSVNRAVKKGEGKEMDQEIKQRIETLKKEKDAVILAHYYVDGEVQEIADYVGDSYYLAELATTVPQKTIIFCGVSFMGESAKILSPEKTVIMADRSADCPMAHMVEVEKIREVRKEYPDVAVVCYVNSMAEIKAESDVCVTSSNALKIVKKLPNKDIFFIPDENLGRFIAKKVPEKHFIFNDGFCHVHKSIHAEDVKKAKEIYDSVIKSNNKYAKAYIMRAGLYRDTKDYDNAQKDLTKAIDLEEKNVDAYFELYNVYKLKKDNDSATGILNKVIDMVASDESMYIPAGKAYYYQGKYDDAMEMFNSAEKNGEADAIYYKGVVYAKKGDNKSALKQYKKYADKESALAKATKKSDVYDKIAKCYMLEEDYDNALLYVRKGLKADDQTAGVKLLKKQVILYEKTGNYKDALKCAREYVKTYPDDKEMKKEVRFIKTRI